MLIGPRQARRSASDLKRVQRTVTLCISCGSAEALNHECLVNAHGFSMFGPVYTVPSSSYKLVATVSQVSAPVLLITL